eukprot:330448-Amphidinium_carterae.1
MLHVTGQDPKVLREASNSHAVSSLSDDALCSTYHVVTFRTLLDRRRLKALPRFLTCDVDPLRAALGGYFGPGSVWVGMFESIARLQICHASTLSELPCTFRGLPIPGFFLS